MLPKKPNKGYGVKDHILPNFANSVKYVILLHQTSIVILPSNASIGHHLRFNWIDNAIIDTGPSLLGHR